MPASLSALKARSLAYMPAWGRTGIGGRNAGITAAMWADSGQFTAAEPSEAVYNNSLWTLCWYLLLREPALRQWQRRLDMTEAQVAAVRSVYLRRTAAEDAVISLEADEHAVLVTRVMQDDEPPDDDALWTAELTEAREMFARAGIAI